MENLIDWVVYFHGSFFIRMVLLFTIMMKYYNWVDKESKQWMVTKLVWYPIAVVFAIADVIYNWYSSITYWDKPAAWDETVSYRADRYVLLYKDKANLSRLEKWRFYSSVGLCFVLGFSDPSHCGGLYVSNLFELFKIKVKNIF
ncbi:MAG: hypothetical protein JRJ00_00760 [Deltaproteobacteria bacterium]|nr:hypothetical protein [Deltaproteobacteria bacterium]